MRETRSHIDGDRRIYDVQFQNDVSETVEFTFDFELPDAEEAALPAIVFPEAQMTSGYVLTENLSEYEMRLKTANVDPAPTAEIPFLPELSKGAGVFRVQPDLERDASRLDRLEKAAVARGLRCLGGNDERAAGRWHGMASRQLPVAESLPAISPSAFAGRRGVDERARGGTECAGRHRARVEGREPPSSCR